MTNSDLRECSVQLSAHWIMNALISLIFPFLAAKSKSIPFAFLRP